MAGKFMYHGLSLKQYCEIEGLNYKTIYNRVLELAKKNPNLSNDEVTKLAFKNYNKFFFEGMSLANYCKLNDIDYQCVLKVIEELSELEPGLSNKLLCSQAIEEVKKLSASFYYNGVLLKDFCKSNPDVKFCDVFMLVRKELKLDASKSVEKIVDDYLENKMHRTYHFIEGMSLKEYCMENDIGYRSVLSRLSSMRRDERFKNLSEQERLDIIIAGSLNDYFKCCLQYEGMSLYLYCKQKGISYKSVYGAMKRLMREKSDLTVEEAISQAVNRILNYKLLQKSLTKAKENIEKMGLNYDLVRQRIMGNLRNNNNLTFAIEEATEFYRKRKDIQDINRAIYYLRNTPDINEEVLQQIIVFFNIDFKLLEMFKSYFQNESQLIIFCWYFGSLGDASYLFNLLSIARNMKKGQLEINVDLFWLVGFYKSGLCDTRYFILEHQKYYVFMIVINLAEKYGITLSREEQDDMVDELNVLLLELIEIHDFKNKGLLISYLNKSLVGYAKNLFRERYMISDVSLDDNYYRV